MLCMSMVTSSGGCVCWPQKIYGLTKTPPAIEDPSGLEVPPSLEDPIGNQVVSDILEDPVFYFSTFSPLISLMNFVLLRY
jgi:hypothetical protein